MRFYKLLWILLLASNCAVAQNHIPNPSFEDTISCPTNISQLTRAKYWINPTQASPDYFNSCNPNPYFASIPYTAFGYQNSHTGNAFAGLYAFIKGMPNVREYVQTRLTDTLVLNHKYLVSFFVNLSNGSQYSLSSIGAYFSSSPISSTSTVVLNYIPQIQHSAGVQLADSINWMLISDTLVSNGSEEYITIGNFKMDSQSDTP